jgi:cysteine desulfurase
MRVYLDHNATSPLKPAAKLAMLAAMETGGNASSVHHEGRAAHALLDTAREKIARAVGALAPMVVLTSGGTEANNLAIKGSAVERIVVSAVEHPSVLEAAKATGKRVEILPVDSDGIVALDDLERTLSDGPKTLVSVMLANNETGVIEPIRDVVAVAHRHGALVHTDAVQALGKVPVNFGVLGVDMMTLAAHKLGGPVGAGALIVRDGLALAPLMHGGGQELRRRAGTENLATQVGFAAVAADMIDVGALRGSLETGLAGAHIFARDAARLPNTVCFAVPGLDAETLLMNLDLDGIAVSSGSACSSGKVATSHVLAAMGVAPEMAKGAIRVSLGWNTSVEDIDRFLAVWTKLRARLGARAAA